MNLTLKNVKFNERLSDETNNFSATLYADERKVGIVSNDGRGGCNRYFWDDRSVGRVVEDWAKTQTTKYEFEKLDQLIDPLFMRELARKEAVNWTKAKTLFRLEGDPKGSWRTIKAKGPKVLDYIWNKYGYKKIQFILYTDSIEDYLDRRAEF